MKKYYIGLIVLGMITLGLTGFVVLQAAGTKQDTQTSIKAQEIANKLNSYVNTKGVPQSLAEANIKYVPSTISYTKHGSDKYEFCITYKHASDGFESVGVTDIFTGSIQRQLSSPYPDDTSSYTPSSLYLPYTHKVGKNCQTVQTYDYNNPSSLHELNSYDSGIGTSTNANDTERQTDIKAMHGQIEAYYAQKGNYPTLANMNDSAWRKTNLKGLDDAALRDPKGTSNTLAAVPAKNIYAYDVTGDNGKACDNLGTECTIYSLTATLDNGSDFTKYSLN